VSRIDDASVYQPGELVSTTIGRRPRDRFDERASTSTTVTETSDELARHRNHDVHDSTSNSRAQSRATRRTSLSRL